MKALLVGGTGPTGPDIAAGLSSRGYQVTLLHRGTHEVPEVAQYEHVHADPHFAEHVRDALAGRRFDIAVLTYGRLRHLMPVVAALAPRVVSVGGTAYGRQRIARPMDESAPRDVSVGLNAKIVETEEVIFQIAEDAGAALTHVRYPYLYGPRQLAPREWSIIRRLRDGRTTIPVVDGGLSRESKAYSENAAHAVLLAVDTPSAAGRMYHISDETTPTDAERARAIARVMGVDVTLVDYPRTVPQAARFWFAARTIGVPDSEFPVTDHVELDLTRARLGLGYRELVGFDEAIERTVRWYLENPLEAGGAQEAQLGDPFDYEAEDRFADALERFGEECRSIPIEQVPIRHAYDHPTGKGSSSEVAG